MGTDLNEAALEALRSAVEGGWEVEEYSSVCPAKPGPLLGVAWLGDWRPGDYKTITVRLRRNDVTSDG